MLSSDNGHENTFLDDNSHSFSDRNPLKGSQQQVLSKPKNVVHVIEGMHDDYETDSYNNFGDVDDFEHFSSDAGQPRLSQSSCSS